MLLLKITTDASAEGTKIKLEGRLVGPWVKELESVWKSVTKTRGWLEVDLRSVSTVDSDGKELLGRMHDGGAAFIVEAPMTKYIVAEAIRGFENFKKRGE